MYYSLLVALILLFWIVGIATGIGATIFYLELENTYIFNPIKSFISNIQNRFTVQTPRDFTF